MWLAPGREARTLPSHRLHHFEVCCIAIEHSLIKAEAMEKPDADARV